MGSNIDSGSRTVICDMCGLDGAKVSQEIQCFEYNDGDQSVVLEALVPVTHCTKCEFSYSDGGAEVARHEAVCRYLGRLTPREVRAIRERRRMTREQFSELVGFGRASLARWETGKAVQTRANDVLLRLLEINQNFDHIIEGGKNSEPEFQFISITPELVNRAAEFQLVCAP